MESLITDLERETLSVVVPVYNSEEILPHLIARLEKTLSQFSYEYEIILVNDGSLDNSWRVILDLSQTHKRVRGINLMRNYGQHNALLCGIRAAKNEIIITIDDDLQHPPEEIEKLLNKLREGYDVVYGAPEKDNHKLWRNLASQLTKIVLQNAMGAETARRVSAFRAFRSHLRKAFDNFEGTYVSIDVLLTWGTTKFTNVFVAHQPRTIGQSNYTLRKLISHALNMITGFSTLPLKFASLVGFLFTFFGFGVLIYVIARFIYSGNPVPGFPFLAASIAIFSGAQLFTLGIIGEYLARIHTRTMNCPSYQILTESKTINE